MAVTLDLAGSSEGGLVGWEWLGLGHPGLLIVGPFFFLKLSANWFQEAGDFSAQLILFRIIGL